MKQQNLELYFMQVQVSLNESLYKGSDDLLKLLDRLMDFRIKPIGLTGVIEKAFLQIGIKNEHKIYTPGVATFLDSLI